VNGRALEIAACPCEEEPAPFGVVWVKGLPYWVSAGVVAETGEAPTSPSAVAAATAAMRFIERAYERADVHPTAKRPVGPHRLVAIA